MFCLSVSVKWLAVKTASEMTYTVSGGALNSTQTKLYLKTWPKWLHVPSLAPVSSDGVAARYVIPFFADDVMFLHFNDRNRRRKMGVQAYWKWLAWILYRPRRTLTLSYQESALDWGGVCCLRCFVTAFHFSVLQWSGFSFSVIIKFVNIIVSLQWR